MKAKKEEIAKIHDELQQLEHPAPAEDDKEYREWLSSRLSLLSREAGEEYILAMDTGDSLMQHTHLLTHAHLTRLIADIKKGMGETQGGTTTWAELAEKNPMHPACHYLNDPAPPENE